MNPALQVQAVRAELGLGELELSGHVRQVAASVAPVLAEYVPARQFVHVALPVLVLYFPATQIAHEPPSGPVNPALQVQAATVELATDELELVGQVMHVVEIVAPVLVEYVPAKQSVHAALPVLILNLPATQISHEPPSGPVNPALQVQAATAELATDELELVGQVMHVVEIVAPVLVEYVPAKQSVHAALPVLILNLPATQIAHEPPSGPVNPALQVQAATAELATDELELVGQVMHVEEIVAPVLVEYVPAPQSVHTALPLVVLYFPATQPVHVPPSGPVNPALQGMDTQAVFDELPLGEVVPAGQVMHALAPTIDEYAPARQFVQTFTLVAAVTPEYLPTEHPVQALVPVAVVYVPARQFGQAAAPSTPEYFPTAQYEQETVLVDAANLPTAQFVQTFTLVAPVALENFPDIHPVQALIPIAAEYFPGSQSTQFPGVPYEPIAQPALTHTLEPAIDVFPAAQGIQSPYPPVEYVLTGQLGHILATSTLH